MSDLLNLLNNVPNRPDWILPWVKREDGVFVARQSESKGVAAMEFIDPHKPIVHTTTKLWCLSPRQMVKLGKYLRRCEKVKLTAPEPEWETWQVGDTLSQIGHLAEVLTVEPTLTLSPASKPGTMYVYPSQVEAYEMLWRKVSGPAWEAWRNGDLLGLPDGSRLRVANMWRSEETGTLWAYFGLPNVTVGDIPAATLYRDGWRRVET